MTHPSKAKGNRGERDTVNYWKAQGFKAERIPLSGAVKGGEYEGDIDVYFRGPDDAPMVGECKVRKSGFKKVFDYLGANDFLVLKQDRGERVYIIPEHILTEMVRR